MVFKYSDCFWNTNDVDIIRNIIMVISCGYSYQEFIKCFRSSFRFWKIILPQQFF